MPCDLCGSQPGQWRKLARGEDWIFVCNDCYDELRALREMEELVMIGYVDHGPGEDGSVTCSDLERFLSRAYSDRFLEAVQKQVKERIADLEAELAAERKGHDTALETARQNRHAYQKAEAEVERLKAALVQWHEYNPGCHGDWISCDACQSMTDEPRRGGRESGDTRDGRRSVPQNEGGQHSAEIRSAAAKIRELEARQLELVNIVKELVMELNKAYGVEACTTASR